MDTRDKLLKARTILVLDQPFFGTLALRLELKEMKSIPTACVGPKVMYYNPAWIESLTMKETVGLLAHEVMHLASGHPWRQGDRKHNEWNIATDYAINNNLLQCGFTLPDGGLNDYELRNLSAEEIYLKQKQEEEEEPDDKDEDGDDETDGDDESGDGEGNNEEDENGTPEEDENGDEDAEGSKDGEGDEEGDEEGDDAEGNNEGDEEGTGDDGTGDGDGTDEDAEGSGGGGNGEGDPVDGDFADPGGCGGVLKAEDPNDEEQGEWKAAVTQALNIAQGNLPGDMVRELWEEVIDPQLPWATLLREFATRTARNDYNWSIPNKRFLNRDVILPSLISDELPEIVIAVDTSGSIDDRALKIFSDEASEIFAAFDTTVRVVYCDTIMQGEEVFTKADMPMEMHPKGGGGTDFRPPFEYVSKEGYTPACLIYFTDLWASADRFPKVEPDYPVMWLTQTKDKKAPWGETVLFNEV